MNMELISVSDLFYNCDASGYCQSKTELAEIVFEFIDFNGTYTGFWTQDISPYDCHAVYATETSYGGNVGLYGSYQKWDNRSSNAYFALCK